MAAAKDLAPHAIRVNTVMPALIGPEDGYMWARQNQLHAASGSPYFSRDPVQVCVFGRRNWYLYFLRA
jgi:NAD(P)-dependent dehydrogenase (short-subunit alcohol dehydrogenase family)